MRLKQLKHNKSAGIDHIPGRLLKAASEIIAPSLVYIYNLSLEKAMFPQEWKIAKVTPLFKSGKRTLIENYRPISVLPNVAKVFEQEVHQQLYNFLEENQILHPSQHGFRTRKSTQTALLSVVDKWLEGMDNSQISVVVFLDLAKAFDTINHRILIRKLDHYGIRGVSKNGLRTTYLIESKL